MVSSLLSLLFTFALSFNHKPLLFSRSMLQHVARGALFVTVREDVDLFWFVLFCLQSIFVIISLKSG